jgi:GT2 family glycosyltransferase
MTTPPMTWLPQGQPETESLLRAYAERTRFPLRVVEVDLAAPLTPLSVSSGTPVGPYVGAVVAVRLHTRPLGFLHVPVRDGTLASTDLADAIWRSLGAAVTEHCRADGLVPPNDAIGLLPGLGSSDDVPCLALRRSVLRDPKAATVVVATRDRPESLAGALTAILDQSYPRYDVLVVDNAPTTTATAELVSGMARRDPRLRYVREDRQGLGWAHRRGLKEATGEIVAFTDDDVHVDRHWLAGLLEGFAAAAAVGCVTGLILPRELDTPPQIWYEQFYGFAKGFTRRIFDVKTHRPADPLFPFTVGRLGAGASMAFSRAGLEAAGGFDPALGPGTPTGGGEDIDVFFKILISGQRLVYEPAALAYHTHRRDYAGLRSQLSTWGIGYNAFLMASVRARPSLLLSILVRLPKALRYAQGVRTRAYRVDADTYPDVLTQATYPPDLRRAELVRLLASPLAYLRSYLGVRAQLAAERRAPPTDGRSA